MRLNSNGTFKSFKNFKLYGISLCRELTRLSLIIQTVPLISLCRELTRLSSIIQTVPLISLCRELTRLSSIIQTVLLISLCRELTRLSSIIRQNQKEGVKVESKKSSPLKVNIKINKIK